MPFGAFEFPGFRPLHLSSRLYEVTARCNLACAHCCNVWKDGVDYPTGELDTEGSIHLIAKTVKEGQLFATVFAKTRVRQVVRISNGALLEEGRIQSLLEAGVDLFELPLPGGDPATHDEALGARSFLFNHWNAGGAGSRRRWGSSS